MGPISTLPGAARVAVARDLARREPEINDRQLVNVLVELSNRLRHLGSIHRYFERDPGRSLRLLARRLAAAGRDLESTEVSREADRYPDVND